MVDTKEKCFVELEFEVNNKTYNIKRIPEQLLKKVKGEGLKQQKHTAELVFPDGRIETNLKAISNIIVNEILGVDKENFNKLLMLPQGKFQKLLTETGEEQVNTFRKIFNTEIYEKITNMLFEEKQNLKKEYDLKVFQNQKKIDSFFKEEELEETKDLNFSEKFKLIIEKNEKNKYELKNIEQEIEKQELKLKELEISIENLKRYKKKVSEKNELEKKREKILDELKDRENFESKKKILKKIENLSAYYVFWKDIEKKREQKECFLNTLKEEKEEQQEKLDYVLNKFSDVSKLRAEKEKVLEKQNELLVIFNNFNILKQFKTKYEALKKEIVFVKREIATIKRKIEIKEIFLKLAEKKDLNKDIRSYIKTKDEFVALKKELKVLNGRYLKCCKDFYEQQAFRLAQNLKEGQECPVCGSVSHPSLKKNVGCESISENFLENLHDLILKRKDSLNLLLFKIKEIKQKIDGKTKIEGDLKNFLDCSLKEEISLKNFFEKKSNGLKINLEKDYEKENLDLNFLLQTKTQKLVEFENEIAIFTEKIPEKLRDEKFLEQYKNDIIRKKEELEKNIELISKEKENEEKKLNIIVLKIENASLNFKELMEEEESSKKDFFKKLLEIDCSLDEFLSYYENFSLFKKSIEKYEENLKELETINLKIETIEKDISSFENVDIFDVETKKKEIFSILSDMKNKEKNLIKIIAINTNCLEEVRENQDYVEQLEENFKTAKILSEVARGSKKRIGFEKYVLTACLNEVLVFANLWLKKATSNRYCFYNLDEKDCLKFNVFDSYSGKIRHVSTLSGGETFAASLALSLGLCERFSNIAGGVELNTMLIDEGFGTLDSTYLDSVVSCLLNLKKAGRQIGVISHVEELKSRIKSQIVVLQNKEGGSKIKLKF